MNPETNPEKFEYLGDGAYAAADYGGVWVMTHRENGWHEIYFEPEVLAALNRFYERKRKGEKA